MFVNFYGGINKFFFVNNYFMKKVLQILQILIKNSLIFAILFIWLRFFIDKTWLALSIALAATFFLQALLFVIFGNRKNQVSLKSKEKEDAQNMFFSLVNLPSPITFFENLIKTRHPNVITNKNYIKIEHNNQRITIFYPKLTFKSLDNDNIILITKKIKKEKPNKLIIICKNYEDECLKLIKNFDFEIILLDQYQTYSSLYKEYEFYPEITAKYAKNEAVKFSDLLSFSLSKSRSKSYMFSALILFVMSFFIRMSVYYYIIISILLLLSLVSFTNTKFNIKKQKELL